LRDQPFLEQIRILQFTLPNDNLLPAHLPQSLSIGRVAGYVAVYLPVPVVSVAFGPAASSTIIVAVPKAPLNQNDRFMAWENNVRLPRQSLTVQPKSEARSVQQGAHY
jgi:hypothetical protein